MPTVPPTYRPISFADEGLLVTPVSDNISDDTSGPTPDPELDDIVLVSAESGDAVTSAYSDQPPAHSDPYIKPHFCLGELNLHSPSSIVGTPFDLSPRFEYPFPTPPALPEPEIPLSTSLPSFSPSVFSLGVPAIGPSLPLAPLPRTRANPRGYSPTHPKLHPREPPMPPGLAKKCRIASVASPTAYPRSRGGSLPSFHLQALDPPSSPRCAHPLAEPRSSTLNCKVNDGSSDAHLNLPRANVVQSVEDAPHSASKQHAFSSAVAPLLCSSPEVTLVLEEGFSPPSIMPAGACRQLIFRLHESGPLPSHPAEHTSPSAISHTTTADTPIHAAQTVSVPEAEKS